MLSAAQAFQIVSEYAPGLTPERVEELLIRHAVTRQVGGLMQEFYDPYAAALAYLMNPATVKSRTEGSVSETYIDPAQVAAYLQQQSAALRESWPPPDVTSTGTAFDSLEISVIGWGR